MSLIRDRFVADDASLLLLLDNRALKKPRAVIRWKPRTSLWTPPRRSVCRTISKPGKWPPASQKGLLLSSLEKTPQKTEITDIRDPDQPLILRPDVVVTTLEAPEPLLAGRVSELYAFPAQ